ncbi:acyltransferase family protein [Corynebacterium stationis]|uniref:acyltransferase family protein n=1 Tax=Corynebacterium stationis TaxID=1705 RepID=UPI00273B9D68|nr:acyltransferase family protein [Corynebacterium stationis]WLP87111.1 acyltransferase family protein [Corynebacterium stationis]
MRLPSIDILRVLVVAMIVHRHTFGSSDLLISSVGVPFFFYLTGWLWRPGRRTVKEEVAHRWRTLGIPFVCWWLLLYPLFLAAFFFRGDLSFERAVSPILRGSYVGTAYTTFWFISALFAVGILMRFLDRFSGTILILVGVSLLAIGGLLGEHLVVVPLGWGVALPSLAFAIFGRLSYRWSQVPAGRAVSLTVLIPAALVTVFFERIDIKYGDFGTPLVSGILVALIIWGVLVLLDSIFLKVPALSGLGAWLGPLTSVAIVVVLVHPVVLWALRFLAPGGGASEAWIFIVALVVPWIGALLLKRTKLAPYLLGQPSNPGARKLRSQVNSA